MINTTKLFVLSLLFVALGSQSLIAERARAPLFLNQGVIDLDNGVDPFYPTCTVDYNNDVTCAIAPTGRSFDVCDSGSPTILIEKVNKDVNKWGWPISYDGNTCLASGVGSTVRVDCEEACGAVGWASGICSSVPYNCQGQLGTSAFCDCSSS